MKKMILGLAILTSVSALATTPFKTGSYGNGKEECVLNVSTGNYFGTMGLIVELGISAVSPWGAVLSQTLDSSLRQMDASGSVELDNATEAASYIVAKVRFDSNGAVESFRARKISSRGDEASEVLSCRDMKPLN